MPRSGGDHQSDHDHGDGDGDGDGDGTECEVFMDEADIATTTAVEERHWWYRERRAVIARELRRFPLPGLAVEIGACGGGNCLEVRARGWDVHAVEYQHSGAAIARSRGLTVVQADARSLPVASGSYDLVIAFDVLEHIDDDRRAASEIFRVLRPGGTALIAVPCDMALWSAHDEASGHVRRYTRDGLTALLGGAGLSIEALWSWNVLLRPAIRLVRRSSTGCDVAEVNPVTNAVMGAIIAMERFLPVRSLPGVSLMMRARRPDPPRRGPL
jgi:SAM-dependent methyltransferase